MTLAGTPHASGQLRPAAGLAGVAAVAGTVAAAGLVAAGTAGGGGFGRGGGFGGCGAGGMKRRGWGGGWGWGWGGWGWGPGAYYGWYAPPWPYYVEHLAAFTIRKYAPYYGKRRLSHTLRPTPTGLQPNYYGSVLPATMAHPDQHLPIRQTRTRYYGNARPGYRVQARLNPNNCGTPDEPKPCMQR